MKGPNCLVFTSQHSRYLVNVPIGLNAAKKAVHVGYAQEREVELKVAMDVFKELVWSKLDEQLRDKAASLKQFVALAYGVSFARWQSIPLCVAVDPDCANQPVPTDTRPSSNVSSSRWTVPARWCASPVPSMELVKLGWRTRMPQWNRPFRFLALFLLGSCGGEILVASSVSALPIVTCRYLAADAISRMEEKINVILGELRGVLDGNPITLKSRGKTWSVSYVVLNSSCCRQGWNSSWENGILKLELVFSCSQVLLGCDREPDPAASVVHEAVSARAGATVLQAELGHSGCQIPDNLDIRVVLVSASRRLSVRKRGTCSVRVCVGTCFFLLEVCRCLQAFYAPSCSRVGSLFWGRYPGARTLLDEFKLLLREAQVEIEKHEKSFGSLSSVAKAKLPMKLISLKYAGLFVSFGLFRRRS